MWIPQYCDHRAWLQLDRFKLAHSVLWNIHTLFVKAHSVLKNIQILFTPNWWAIILMYGGQLFYIIKV